MYGLGAISGLAAVGAVRGAQLLLAPVVALTHGDQSHGGAGGGSGTQALAGATRSFCMVLGGSQAAACILWGAGLLFIPPARRRADVGLLCGH